MAPEHSRFTRRSDRDGGESVCDDSGPPLWSASLQLPHRVLSQCRLGDCSWRRSTRDSRGAQIGMVVNLYVTIPPRHSGAHPSNYLIGSFHSVAWASAHGAGALAIHAALRSGWW